MRVLLSVVGTRGDVQPAFALALRAREHGHDVHLCIPLPSEDNVSSWNERARERVNANRARLGLSHIDDVLRYVVTDHPWLATDPALSPAPSVEGMRVVQTGAWMLDDVRPLPDDLNAFLDAGESPVYLGFGSMPVVDGAGRVLIEASRAAGRRAIVSRGWGGLSLIDDAPDCIEIDEVDHWALFGRVASVVHHGGAGTTHAAARAGVPQVIVPMFGDQPFWASRVRALGVGASILPTELSGERLASVLHDVTQPRTTERAAALARQMVPAGANVAAQLLSELVS